MTEYDAIKILGTMQGGYSIGGFIQLLESKNDNFAKLSSNELKNILIFDYFYDIEKLSKKGNTYATNILASWANGEWFTKKVLLKKK